jgi:hypothetical protein
MSMFKHSLRLEVSRFGMTGLLKPLEAHTVRLTIRIT